LEHVYVLALEIELRRLGLQVRREVTTTVYYDGVPLCPYRIDMLVNDKVVIEVKSTYALRRGEQRQLLNLLRATDLEVGLFLHFGPEANFYRMFAANHRKARTA
jgi:GxxExxY protein